MGIYSLVQDTISKDEILKLSKWLLKGEKLTKGKITLEFEKKFSKYLNRKYSLFVNSGSSANLLMLSALIVGRHSFWIKKYGLKNLKNADVIHDFGLYLPNNFNLKKRDIEYICKCFKEMVEKDFKSVNKLNN